MEKIFEEAMKQTLNQFEAQINHLSQASQKQYEQANLGYTQNFLKQDPQLWAWVFASSEVCWWFNSKNISFQKQILKKICATHGVFLKLHKCIEKKQKISYLIVIDGYLPQKNIIEGVSQALKLFKPISVMRFKMRQVVNFTPYGSSDYSLQDDDHTCIICLDVKGLGGGQNCCGKKICYDCRKGIKDNICFFCKREMLLRQYMTQKEIEECRNLIQKHE